MRPRNEALDCRVYAVAALAILNTNVDQLANRYEKQTSVVVLENEVEQTEQNKVMLQRPVRRSSKQSGFVNSWR
jgi:phage terminase large subunit GpA-like protein